METIELAVQKQVIAALHQAGAVGPEPEVTAHYLADREGRAWQPIAADGKPASEMIVEERDSRTWANGAHPSVQRPQGPTMPRLRTALALFTLLLATCSPAAPLPPPHAALTAAALDIPAGLMYDLG